MAVNEDQFKKIKDILEPANVTLVAVSKTKPIEDIKALYALGQRDFGENYVQELVDKQAILPTDIRWHFIGHLQTNKVKYLAPFVHLIHGVDSEKLLTEINKQGKKLGKKINCLIQIHISKELTKFGFSPDELKVIDASAYPYVNILGLMGMASNTENESDISKEFKDLHELQLKELPEAKELSMGMSGDYEIAINNSSTIVRIGSLLFGKRE